MSGAASQRADRAPTRDLFGLLLLDKSAGISSNKALQTVKRLFSAAKAGHGGSLDPLATGMLPIFFGPATRLAGYLLDARKEYRVTARLGVATTTGDAEGAVTVDRSTETGPEALSLANALAAFRGEIEQVPPMYSALKKGGVPLYRLARAGQEVERLPRRVVIEELTLERYEWPNFTLRVRCSKGTYVRTLVEDVAKAVGTVGHVAELRRLGVEPFLAEPMYTFAALVELAASGHEALDACLLPPDRALGSWPVVALSATDAERLCHGQAVALGPSLAAQGGARVYGPQGRFIATANVTADGQLVPDRVFVR